MSEFLAKDLLFSKHSLFNERRYSSLHYHNEIELYLLLKGRIKYFVDNKTFKLHEGDLIIIPKGVLHSTDSEDCLYNERLLLSLEDKYFYPNIIPCIKELCSENIIHIPKENRILIENMFYKIESEYRNSYINKDLLLKLYINELLAYLHRYRQKNIGSAESTDILMQNIAEYINLNYDKELSLKTLCKKFCISESYISRRFKEALGTCVSEYINYVRVTNAEKLLKTERLPITEVALRCGFNDSSYFASVFKKLKGVTPYKFLKNHK